MDTPLYDAYDGSLYVVVIHGDLYIYGDVARRRSLIKTISESLQNGIGTLEVATEGEDDMPHLTTSIVVLGIEARGASYSKRTLPKGVKPG